MAKRPHRGVVDCEVPASPYAQIGTLGLKVDYRFVVLVLTDDFCGSVCRVIVHDDDVEWKRVSCASADRMASSMVRARLRTG